jgi:hypothetical protein
MATVRVFGAQAFRVMPITRVGSRMMGGSRPEIRGSEAGVTSPR